jgi:hypothetical protein
MFLRGTTEVSYPNTLQNVIYLYEVLSCYYLIGKLLSFFTDATLKSDSEEKFSVQIRLPLDSKSSLGV